MNTVTKKILDQWNGRKDRDGSIASLLVTLEAEIDEGVEEATREAFIVGQRSFRTRMLSLIALMPQHDLTAGSWGGYKFTPCLTVVTDDLRDLIVTAPFIITYSVDPPAADKMSVGGL